MKRVLFIPLLLLVSLVAVAQSDTPTVKARIEPDSIFIGDQFDFIIEVEKDLVQTTLFPEFTPQGESLIELVEVMPIDTLERDGRRLKIAQRYRLAAFQEGLINMGKPGVLYADKNIVDTLYTTDSLVLKVATFQIDSTSQSIYDLKPQLTLPFKLAEIRGYLMWGLLLAALIALALYGLHRYLEARGRHLKDLFKPAPPEPPHVVAIKALEALHHQKLWQNNKHKLYYSTLTDILRTYIAGRWGVGAMEMTSDEIIAAMREVELPEKARMDLTSVVMDADLVKFAKFTPEAEQNESDYTKVYYFVEETKPVEVLPVTEENE
ncbi:MAG: hypothetical protein IJB62_02335 [Alistipes sp.]|nr:hypothetical protein [Alistipes sp.]